MRVALNRAFLLKLIFVGAVISYLAFIQFRGTVFSDEGYILNSGLRIISGQVPYRDFDVVYTPVSFLATAGVFKVLGVSIFSGRVLMLLLSTLTFGFVFKIIKSFSRSTLLAGLGAFIYLFWGPGQINFPWPTMFALTFGVLTAFFLMRQKSHRKYIFLAGFMGIMAFLSKQNLGAGLLIAYAAALFYLDKKRVTEFIAGAVFIFLIWMAYLFLNGAVTAFFQNLYFHTFQKILVEGTISTPFITPSGNFIGTIGKAIFYLLPILAGSTAALILMFKKQHQFMWVPILSVIYYVLGIRPVTDYNHFVPLLSLTGLSLAIIVRFTKNDLVKWGTGSLLFGLAALGFYLSLWGNYYRWDKPLVMQNTFVQDNRIKIWTTKDTATKISWLRESINKSLLSEEKIFVNIYLPMVYFLTGHQNATRFDYFSDSATNEIQQTEMVNDIKVKKVNLVVGNLLNTNYRSKVNQYLVREFMYRDSFDTYVIFQRTSLPR
jgi:hypothetical protein